MVLGELSWLFWFALPGILSALLAAAYPRSARWLFVAGAALSAFGALVAWNAPNDDGEGFLAISSQAFYTILTVWWTITWLPGVPIGWAIGRRRRAPQPRRSTDVRRRRGSLPPPPRATPVDEAELTRPLDRDVQAALAPYRVEGAWEGATQLPG